MKSSAYLGQGTGGVSMFTLLLCLASGIKPIITSSSDAKLEKIKVVSPNVEGINYRQYPDVAKEAMRLTNGKGVDYVINNVGMKTVLNNIQSLRKYGGIIALVGFLEGIGGDWTPEDLFSLIIKGARLQ
jgi:NADPH:quinone reductase-like Zn-dependent oxidoreductase